MGIQYIIYCPYCGALGMRKIGVGEIQDELEYSMHQCGSCNMVTRIVQDVEKKEEKWTLENQGVCLPDYWGGYHKPCLGVYVHNGMMKEELVQAIVNEWNSVYDYLTFGDNKWPDFTSNQVREMAEEFIHEDGPLFTHLEPEDEADEDRESVYLYISCEKQQ